MPSCTATVTWMLDAGIQQDRLPRTAVVTLVTTRCASAFTTCRAPTELSQLVFARARSFHPETYRPAASPLSDNLQCPPHACLKALPNAAAMRQQPGGAHSTSSTITNRSPHRHSDTASQRAPLKAGEGRPVQAANYKRRNHGEDQAITQYRQRCSYY